MEMNLFDGDDQSSQLCSIFDQKSINGSDNIVQLRSINILQLNWPVVSFMVSSRSDLLDKFSVCMVNQLYGD